METWKVGNESCRSSGCPPEGIKEPCYTEGSCGRPGPHSDPSFQLQPHPAQAQTHGAEGCPCVDKTECCGGNGAHGEVLGTTPSVCLPQGVGHEEWGGLASAPGTAVNWVWRPRLDRRWERATSTTSTRSQALQSHPVSVGGAFDKTILASIFGAVIAR